MTARRLRIPLRAIIALGAVVVLALAAVLAAAFALRSLALPLRTFGDPSPGPRRIDDIAVSANGDVLAAVANDWDASRGHTGCRVRAWSRDGRLLRSLALAASSLTIALSPEGDVLAAANDHAVVIAPLRARSAPLSSFATDISDSGPLAFSRGRVLAVGADHRVELWSVEPPRRLDALETRPPNIQCLAWTPDGQRLIAGFIEGEILLWSAAAAPVGSGATVTSVKGASFPRSLSVSPDGELVAVGCEEALELRATRDGALVRSLGRPKEAAWCVSFSDDGRIVAVGGQSGALALLSVPDLRVVAERPRSSSAADSDGVRGLAFWPGTRWLASGQGDAVRIWWVPR